VQLDLPMVHYDAGHVTGVESGTGIGDIEFRIGDVLRSEGLFRYAVGAEAEFDTAGGPPLGDGIFRLSPIVAFAVQRCRTFEFQTFVQFNQSAKFDQRHVRQSRFFFAVAAFLFAAARMIMLPVARFFS